MVPNSELARTEIYTANGQSGQEFPFDFRVLSGTSGADIAVWKDDTPVLPWEYTTTLTSGGGYVKFKDDYTPSSGAKICIVRNVPITQETDLNDNKRFYPHVIEDGLDKLTMICQQLAEGFNRTIQVTPTGGGYVINSRFILSSATAVGGFTVSGGLLVDGPFAQTDSFSESGPLPAGGDGEAVVIEAARANAASGGAIVHAGGVMSSGASGGLPCTWVRSSFGATGRLTAVGIELEDSGGVLEHDEEGVARFRGAIVSSYDRIEKPEYEIKTFTSAPYHETQHEAYPYSATFEMFHMEGAEIESGVPFEPYIPDTFGPECVSSTWFDSSVGAAYGVSAVVIRNFDGSRQGAHVDWDGGPWATMSQYDPPAMPVQAGGVQGELFDVIDHMDLVHWGGPTFTYNYENDKVNDPPRYTSNTITFRIWDYEQVLSASRYDSTTHKTYFPFAFSGNWDYHYSGSVYSATFSSLVAPPMESGARWYVKINGEVAVDENIVRQGQNQLMTGSGGELRFSGGQFLVSGGAVQSWTNELGCGGAGGTFVSEEHIISSGGSIVSSGVGVGLGYGGLTLYRSVLSGGSAVGSADPIPTLTQVSAMIGSGGIDSDGIRNIAAQYVTSGGYFVHNPIYLSNAEAWGSFTVSGLLTVSDGLTVGGRTWLACPFADSNGSSGSAYATVSSAAARIGVHVNGSNADASLVATISGGVVLNHSGSGYAGRLYLSSGGLVFSGTSGGQVRSGRVMLEGDAASGAIVSGAEFTTTVGGYTVALTSGGGLAVSGSGASVVLSGGQIAASAPSEDGEGETGIAVGPSGTVLHYSDVTQMYHMRFGAGGIAVDHDESSPVPNVTITGSAVATKPWADSRFTRQLVTSTDYNLDDPLEPTASIGTLDGGVNYVYTVPLYQVNVTSVVKTTDASYLHFTLDSVTAPTPVVISGVSYLNSATFEGGKEYLVGFFDGMAVVNEVTSGGVLQ